LELEFSKILLDKIPGGSCAKHDVAEFNQGGTVKVHGSVVVKHGGAAVNNGFARVEKGVIGAEHGRVGVEHLGADVEGEHKFSRLPNLVRFFLTLFNRKAACEQAFAICSLTTSRDRLREVARALFIRYMKDDPDTALDRTVQKLSARYNEEVAMDALGDLFIEEVT